MSFKKKQSTTQAPLTKRGQGTVEYLTIMGVIAVIGLIAVVVLTDFTKPVGGVSEETSIKAWASASPFAIVSRSKTSGEESTTLLVMKNRSNSTITLKNIWLGSDTNTTQTPVNSGQTIQKTFVGTGNTCEQGIKYTYLKEQIIINYQIGSLDKNQLGHADLIITCS